jgi:type IV pilus assembly protein PilQ
MAAAPSPAPQAVPPPAPSRAIEVTGVETQEAGTGGLVLVVVADGPIATYESFTLSDPPRLIVDIPNATHAIPQPIAARPPMVTAIRSSQYRERPVRIVRVVLDLRATVPYQIATADNQLRVQLGTAAGAAPAALGAAAAPTGRVTRVDLQSVRGRQRIAISTSGKVTYKVTESAEPLQLLVDIAGAEIAPADARTLDLRQVTSPLNRLQASQLTPAPDPVVRVTADLRGPTRYDVQQTASAILVEILSPLAAAAPLGAPPVAPGAPPAATPGTAPPAAAPIAGTPGTGRLSMDFKDADINNLLRIIAEVSGMNVVSGDDVKGRVTVRLVNVEWQQALDVILKINNLGYEIDGNIIRVAPLSKLEAERKAREDARIAAARARVTEQQAQVQVEPLVDRIIPVNHAKASEVVKNLDRLKTPGRTEASVVVDDRTNTLIIRETATTLAKMETLLKRLDLPEPQVLIEARLVEATRTFSQSLGIEWGFAFNTNIQSGQAGKFLTPTSVFTSQVGTTLSVPTTTVPLAISFPASGTSPAGVGIITGDLLNNALLGVRLSAAENEGKVRTLSAPKVATLNNLEAEIRQGTQVPYTTVDSSGRTVVAFQDAFIRMKVTPHITNDRRISMKIEAERTFPGDRIDFQGGFAFVLNQRKATTNVLISNGATIVIGGLMQVTDTVAEAGLPWMKNIPALGWLFKSHSVGPNDKTELLIFLTPTILEEPKLS